MSQTDILTERDREHARMIIRMLRDYVAWVQGGAMESPNSPFGRGRGLCYTYKNYYRADTHALGLEVMKRLWEANGWKSNFPFGGHDVYQAEARQHLMHLNPMRMEWVQRTITDLKAWLNEGAA